MSTLSNDFLALLLSISKSMNTRFSGIGLLLYKDLTVISKYHRSLISNFHEIPSLELGSISLVQYLQNISDYSHPYHDGFHFINQNGLLTHVAQFLSPPINTEIANVPGQGARTLCALYGSNIPEVLMIGTVSTNKNIHIYKNGEVVKRLINDLEKEESFL